MKTTNAMPTLAALLLGACGPTTYVVHQTPGYNPCDSQFYEPYACQRAINSGGYYYGSTYYPLPGGHTFIYYQQQEQQFVAKGGRPMPVDATKLMFKAAPQSKDSVGTQYKFTPKTPAAVPAQAPSVSGSAPTKPYVFTEKAKSVVPKFQTDKSASSPASSPPKSYSFTSKRK